MGIEVDLDGRLRNDLVGSLSVTNCEEHYIIIILTQISSSGKEESSVHLFALNHPNPRASLAVGL